MEGRTPVSSLGRIHNSRYTIPANTYIVSHIGVGEKRTIMALARLGKSGVDKI